MQQEQGSDTLSPTGSALSLRELETAGPRLCPTCYTLKRQDEEYFGRLREAVLERAKDTAAVFVTPGWGNARTPCTSGCPESPF